MIEVLRSGGPVELIDPDDERAMAEFRAVTTQAALDVRLAAESGEAQAAVDALDQHRLLCAHREGPYGVAGWNRQVERLVAERTGVTHYEEWYAGRPVLVTANDYGQGLYNGDIGVTIRRARRAAARRRARSATASRSSPPPGWPACRRCTR